MGYPVTDQYQLEYYTKAFERNTAATSDKWKVRKKGLKKIEEGKAGRKKREQTKILKWKNKKIHGNGAGYVGEIVCQVENSASYVWDG